MASSTPKLCTSFKVDDVQELAKLKRDDVPERYIRPAKERIGCTALRAAPGLHAPLIDMAMLFSSNHSARQHEMDRLAGACNEWGFFQLFNHGIDLGLLDLIKEVAREFYKLPIEEKEKYPMIHGTIQGYGHAFVLSDEQKLDWCDMMALATMRNSLRKENLWPSKPLKFSDTVEAYSMEVFKLCRKLLSIIAENLGLNPNIFVQMFGESVQAVRMNFYPPCPRPELVLGLTANSDGSVLTVLLQDDDVKKYKITNEPQKIARQQLLPSSSISCSVTKEIKLAR